MMAGLTARFVMQLQSLNGQVSALRGPRNSIILRKVLNRKGENISFKRCGNKVMTPQSQSATPCDPKLFFYLNLVLNRKKKL